MRKSKLTAKHLTCISRIKEAAVNESEYLLASKIKSVEIEIQNVLHKKYTDKVLKKIKPTNSPMRRLKEILNTPLSQLTPQEIIKAVRHSINAKAAVLVYLDNNNKASALFNTDGINKNDKQAKSFTKTLNKYHLKGFLNTEEWKLPF